MKLKESKEKVPASFVTTYIAEAWDKIGYLKTDIEAIKDQYSGTKVVCDCLQDIMDAYLIAAGRLQAFLDDKDYVEIPDLEENSKVEESLTEDVILPKQEDINLHDVEVKIDNVKIAPVLPEDELDEIDSAESKVDVCPVSADSSSDSEDSFEYTCDFGEPELTQSDLDNFNQIIHPGR